MSEPVTREVLREELAKALAKALAKHPTREELANHPTRDELRAALANHPTHDDLRKALANHPTHEDLAKYAAVIDANFTRIDRRFDALILEIRSMKIELDVDLARHVRASDEQHRTELGIVDDKYADLPERVAALEKR